jgi:hypothetical protein
VQESLKLGQITRDRKVNPRLFVLSQSQAILFAVLKATNNPEALNELIACTRKIGHPIGKVIDL